MIAAVLTGMVLTTLTDIDTDNMVGDAIRGTSKELPLFRCLEPWKLCLIMIAMAGLTLVLFLQSLGAVNDGRNPQLAAKLWPQNGLAEANVAHAAVVGYLPGARANQGHLLSKREIRSIARNALALEPTADRALSALAMLSSRDLDEQLALLRLVRRVNPRNEVALLKLVELNLNTNDFSGAINKIGLLLQVKPDLQKTIIPTLLPLLQHRQSLYPLSEVLEIGPTWAEEFWRTAPTYEAGLKNLVVVRKMTPVREGYVQRRNDEFLLQALVDSGDIALAEGLATEIVSGFRLVDGLRNSHFDRAPAGRPFDWKTFSTGSLSVDHDVTEGELNIFPSSSASGSVVASQLVRLSHESYSIVIGTSNLSPSDASRVRPDIICAENPSREKKSLALSDEVDGSILFRRDAGCSYYYFRIKLHQELNRAMAPFQIESIVLEENLNTVN